MVAKWIVEANDLGVAIRQVHGKLIEDKYFECPSLTKKVQLLESGMYGDTADSVLVIAREIADSCGVQFLGEL